MGGRGKAETIKVAGYSVEAAVGARFSLKVPKLLRDIVDGIGF